MRRLVLLALPLLGGVALYAGRPWIALALFVAWIVAGALVLLRIQVEHVAALNRDMAGVLEAIADEKEAATSSDSPRGARIARGRRPGEAPARDRR